MTMVGALVGAVTCGPCGAPSDPSSRDRICGTCGARRVAAASGAALGSYSGLLTGVQSAPPYRRRLAIVVDLLPVVILSASIIVALTGGYGTGTAAVLSGTSYCALALVAYLGLLAFVRQGWGRSPGRLLFNLRLVDDLTGAPPRLSTSAVASRGWSSLRPRRDLVVADLSRGRDPLEAGTASFERSLLVPAASDRDPDDGAFGAGARYPDAERSPSVVLALDTGERLSMETTLLVGRLPAWSKEVTHPIFAWPDLSRSLSKTHALLEWTGTVLWVTDLHSTNGSALVAPDGVRQPLVPGLRGPAAPGWTVELGERSFEVHPSGVLAVAEETVSRESIPRAASAAAVAAPSAEPVTEPRGGSVGR